MITLCGRARRQRSLLLQMGAIGALSVGVVFSGAAFAQDAEEAGALDAGQLAAVQTQVTSALANVNIASFNPAEFDPAALCNCIEPAPPPPPVRMFIVFFDFDRSDLTVQAQQVVASAVEEIERNGAARIQVIGHTDTAYIYPGTQAAQDYNQALSERRAESVKAEMVRLGVNPDEIFTEGRSFNDLLVQTGPGVREPQNRRAVIDLGEFNLQVASNSTCDAPDLVQAISDLNVMLVRRYGPEAASEIGSVILASATNAGIPEEAIGAGIGRGANEIAQTNNEAAVSIAQVIANEGTPEIVASFAAGVCNPALASIAQAPPAAVAAGPAPIFSGGNPTPTTVPILAASAS